MGDQRHEQQRLDLRPDHGSAPGVGVGGRSGRGRHHQAVAAEGGHRLPIDPDGDLEHAGAVALLQSRLIQGPVVSDRTIGGGDFNINGHTGLHRVSTINEVGDDSLDRIGVGLRQEADVARVDPHQGDVALASYFRGAQNRAIPAQHEDEIDVSAEGGIDGLDAVSPQRRLRAHDSGGGRGGFAVARYRRITAVPFEHHHAVQRAPCRRWLHRRSGPPKLGRLSRLGRPC